MELEQKYNETKAYLQQLVNERAQYMSASKQHPLLNVMTMRIKIERTKLERLEEELKKKIQ
jgi:hypothetical protein